MAVRITPNLDDASTAGMRLTLLDAAGDQVSANVIASISYTLSDRDGNIINELQDKDVTPVNPVDIVLTADDMVISGSAVQVGLLLTVTWIYTDALLGAGAQKVVEISL